MIIEPVIGRRPDMVAASAEWMVRTTLGRNAVSEDKKKIEGRWSEERIFLVSK